MFRVSTRSQYGLRAMVCLAKAHREICPLRVIAKKEGLSFDYLEKIIAKLVKAKLIKTKKGAKGGYSLTRNPSRIKIGEIIRALEGKDGLVSCITDKGVKSVACPMSKECLARNFWVKIQKSLNSTLNSITLADLIKDGKK